jgi:hypothetical protein
MKTVFIPVIVGLIFILLGKPLAGALIMSFAIIFGLRLVERQFTEQLVPEWRSTKLYNPIFAHIIDATSSFLQQFTNSFFACMFWMTQGNMSIVSPPHWIKATQTGLGAAVILEIILQVPRLSFLMRNRWRSFLVTSIVVSSVDRCVHPGHFGGPFAEALLTGMTAYGINLAIDAAYELFLGLLKA